jgi:membrane-associated protein
MSVWEFLVDLTNPETIIDVGGLALLLFVVFAETGLLIGFFLPGDSLLFTAGLLCGTGAFDVNIITLVAGICVAGILGNITGYLFGKRVGDKIFTRDDNLIFKKRYITITHDFYKRHGGRTLVLGRFLPIIRTFAPILAGVVKIDFRRFMIYNVIGSVSWVFSLTLTGYLLGIKYPGIKEYLGYIVVFLVIVTLIPVVRTYRKERKLQK